MYKGKIDNLITEFEGALIRVNRVKAEEIFENCLKQSVDINFVEELTMNTLERIGEKWENGTLSLAQVYMSSVICEDLVLQCLPTLNVKPKPVPKMAIAVLQDQHALGKRIVYSVLRAGGYELLDFGQGLDVDALVHKTIENKIEILLISTLMYPSALKVNEVKEKLRARGVATKIIVGGAPFRLDKTLWKRVNADADGKNATHVIKVINALQKGELYDFL